MTMEALSGHDTTRLEADLVTDHLGLQGLDMTSIEADLLEAVVVVRLTCARSTYNGNRRAAVALMDALRAVGIDSIDELNQNRLAAARLCESIAESVLAGDLGAAASTVDQRYTTLVGLLRTVGLVGPSLKILQNSKTRFVSLAPNQERKQATITDAQIHELIDRLEALPDREDFFAGSVRVSRVSRLRLRLFMYLAMTYNARHESIMGITRADVRPDSCTLVLRKGDAKGIPITREMNGMVWDAYTDLVNEIGPEEALLTDSSRIYKRIRALMAEVGVEAVNNRYGTHRFRRAWKEWCDTKGVHVSIASAGLNHSSTEITDRVYSDLEARQVAAASAMHVRAQEFDVLRTRLETVEKQHDELLDLLQHVLQYGFPTYDSDHECDNSFVSWSGEVPTHGFKQDESEVSNVTTLAAKGIWWVRPDLNWGLAPPKRQV